MGMSGSSQRGSRAAMSEINVTPLVDVMLVLLIMFMVTAPLMQQGIDVNLPKTSSSGTAVSEDPFIVVIGANRSISIAKNPVRMGDLGAKLKSIFKNKKDKAVYIQADRKVDYGVVAEAMAEIRGAGIYNINLVTMPKDQ